MSTTLQLVMGRGDMSPPGSEERGSDALSCVDAAEDQRGNLTPSRG